MCIVAVSILREPNVGDFEVMLLLTKKGGTRAWRKRRERSTFGPSLPSKSQRYSVFWKFSGRSSRMIMILLVVLSVQLEWKCWNLKKSCPASICFRHVKYPTYFLLSRFAGWVSIDFVCNALADLFLFSVHKCSEILFQKLCIFSLDQFFEKVSVTWYSKDIPCNFLRLRCSKWHFHSQYFTGTWLMTRPEND